MFTNHLIKSDIAKFRYRNLPSDAWDAEAAVLVCLTREPTPQLVLTKRAAHLSSHPGQVAFPGGKRERQDLSLEDTALRETYEEIGVPPHGVEVYGRLSQRMSRYGLGVTPIVGAIAADTQFRLQDSEIAELFCVPLSFFVEHNPSRIDLVEREHGRLRVPAWRYGEHDIWGLTALIIGDLLSVVGRASTLVHLEEPSQ